MRDERDQIENLQAEQADRLRDELVVLRLIRNAGQLAAGDPDPPEVPKAA